MSLSRSSWRVKRHPLYPNLCELSHLSLFVCDCVLHYMPAMFVLLHMFLCLHSCWCVCCPLSVCVHGCDRSPVATQITLSLWSQSPVVLFSMVDERLGLPSTRTCSKKEGCHCRLTWLIMVYNLLLGAPLGGGDSASGLCVSRGGLHRGGQKAETETRRGCICCFITIMAPSWLESGINRVNQICYRSAPPSVT